MCVTRDDAENMVLPQNLRDGRAVAEFSRERVVAEYDDRFPRSREPFQRLLQEGDILAADIAVPHLQVGPGRKTDQHDAFVFDGEPVASPEFRKGLPRALRPVRLVVAGDGVERFPNFRELFVDILQLGIRTPVREIAGHDHEVAVVRVDLRNQLRHEPLIRIPRRNVEVGEHRDLQFRRG